MFAKARACGRPRTCSRASKMTAAAVAAAATAAAAAAVTAVTAAAAAVPSTRYERTLRNCVRDLSDFAGCTKPGAFWDEARFREWAHEHQSEAPKQAGRFVARLLRDKAANRSRVHGSPARGSLEGVRRQGRSVCAGRPEPADARKVATGDPVPAERARSAEERP